jgi:hypothetical protein
MANDPDLLHPCVGPTLLTYSILLDPDPFQVNGQGTFTLVVSKSTPGTITCSEIKVTLLVGKAAQDLTTDASSIVVEPPSDSWGVDSTGGVITLTPSGAAGQFGAQGVPFVFAGIAVNDQPGTTMIRIDETASSASDPTPSTRCILLPVAKFPVQFSVSNLVITPAEVAFGGSTSVMWTGTPATYMLEYPGCPPGGKPVSNVGPFEMQDLTSFPAVFTLTASLSVPGQDEPLVLQRQKAAELLPQLKILDFSASTTLLSGADVLALGWEVELATSLSLQLSGIPGEIDVTGLSGCSVSSNGLPTLVVADPTGKQLGTLSPGTPFPEFLNFLLTASNSSSGSVQRGLQIQVAAPVIWEFSWSMRVWPHGEGRTYFVQWNTGNAAPVSIQPEIGAVSASGITSVNYGITYTLSAPGFGATLTSQQTPG